MTQLHSTDFLSRWPTSNGLLLHRRSSEKIPTSTWKSQMPKLRKVSCSLYTLSFSFGNHPLKRCGSKCSWLKKNVNFLFASRLVSFLLKVTHEVACFIPNSEHFLLSLMYWDQTIKVYQADWVF